MNMGEVAVLYSVIHFYLMPNVVDKTNEHGRGSMSIQYHSFLLNAYFSWLSKLVILVLFLLLLFLVDVLEQDTTVRI